jgi:hypothetical protein
MGHKSKSHKLFQSNLKVIACRLCMSPLLGSSRKIRLTMIFSSRSVNFYDQQGLRDLDHTIQLTQPLGRHHDLVCVGDGAIINIDQIPIINVSIPSIRKSHRQPS